MVVPAHPAAEQHDARVRIRRLGAGERRAVLDVFRGLSDRSRRLCFHGPKPVLRAPDLEQLVDVGCCGREAVAAVEIAGGRSVGVARYVCEPGSVAGNDAVLALVRGLGTVVSSRLADGAFEIVVALPHDVQPFPHANRRRLQEGSPHRGAEGRRDEADR